MKQITIDEAYPLIQHSRPPPVEIHSGEDLDSGTPDIPDLSSFKIPAEGGVANVSALEEFAIPWYVSPCINNQVDFLKRSIGMMSRRDTLRVRRKCQNQTNRFEHLESRYRLAQEKDELRAFHSVSREFRKQKLVIEWELNCKEVARQKQIQKEQAQVERERRKRKREKELKKRQEAIEKKRQERAKKLREEKMKKKKKGVEEDEEIEEEPFEEELEMPEDLEEEEIPDGQEDEEVAEPPVFEEEEFQEEEMEHEAEEHEEDGFLLSVIGRALGGPEGEEGGEGEEAAIPAFKMSVERKHDEDEDGDKEALQKVILDCSFRLALVPDRVDNDTNDVFYLIRSAAEVNTENEERLRVIKEREEARAAKLQEAQDEEAKAEIEEDVLDEEQEIKEHAEIDLLTLCVSQRAVECGALLIHLGSGTTIVSEYLQSLADNHNFELLDTFIACCAQAAYHYKHPVSLDFSWVFHSVIPSMPLAKAEELLNKLMLAQIRPAQPIDTESLSSGRDVYIFCKLLLKLLALDTYSIVVQKFEPTKDEESEQDNSWLIWDFEGKEEEAEEPEPEAPQRGEDQEDSEFESLMKDYLSQLSEHNERKRLRKWLPPRKTTFAAPLFVHYYLRKHLDVVKKECNLDYTLVGDIAPDYPPKGPPGQISLSEIPIEEGADTICGVIQQPTQPEPCNRIPIYWSDCLLLLALVLRQRELFDHLLAAKCAKTRTFGRPSAVWELIYKQLSLFDEDVVANVMEKNRAVFRFGNGVLIDQFINEQYHLLPESHRKLFINKFYNDVTRNKDAILKNCKSGQEVLKRAEEVQQHYIAAMDIIKTDKGGAVAVLEKLAQQFDLELINSIYLHQCIVCCNLKALEWLLDRGCEPVVAENEFTRSVDLLTCVVKLQYVDAVLLLVRRGFNLCVPWEGGHINSVEYITKNYSPSDAARVLGAWDKTDTMRCDMHQNLYGLVRKEKCVLRGM